METLAPGFPLLTASVAERLIVAQDRAEARITVSLDLGRSTSIVEPQPEEWLCTQGHFPYAFGLEPDVAYGWNGAEFVPLQAWHGDVRYRLLAAASGAPVCDIDGVQSPVDLGRSPVEDAQRKVVRIAPQGKRILDCCAGLGYLAQACLAEQAEHVVCFDENPAMARLRSMNPWSARSGTRLRHVQGNLADQISDISSHAFDAVIRDPAIAVEAAHIPPQAFFDELARVIAPNGQLLHCPGAASVPGRRRATADALRERLHASGFVVEREGDWLVGRLLPGAASLAIRR